MTAPEFSRPIALDKIGARAKHFEFEATPAECKALARFFSIPKVTRVAARASLRRLGDGKQVRLEAQVSAELVQICVITLQPLTVRFDEPFERVYSLDAAGEAGSIVIDFAADDPPDPVIDGQIDVGEAAIEHLALVIDPFPRAADARFDAPPETSLPEAEMPSPFAVLASPSKKR
jgi:uncharacterized metal-binding protein YceD (DUF177 family)